MSEAPSDKPLVARCEPTVVTLEPGIYWWCACGRSKEQPFCDGSHETTDIKPVKLRIADTREVALCNCKHSEPASPYCDGTHHAMKPSTGGP
jgi:CDGSH-type Zn-finger protein